MQVNEGIKELSHLGLVAATIKRMGLVDFIDQILPIAKDKGANLSMGNRTAGLIFNALGFIDTRLYMTSQHMQQVAVDRLLGEQVQSHQFTDDCLGRLLDRIADYGVSQFFTTVSLEVIEKLGVKNKTIHFDTTSLSLYGTYKSNEADKEICQPAHGYSKDGRPDLKQVVLMLGTLGSEGLPIMMQPISGNVSDKTTLGQAPIMLQEILKSMEKQKDFIAVMDSAGYELSLTNSGLFKWLSRVPETHKKAREWVHSDIPEQSWVDLGDGYRQVLQTMDYKGVTQRFALIYSQQAFDRESHSFQKKVETERDAANKALKTLSQETFKCENDAMKALKKLGKRWKYHFVQATVEPVQKHEKAGRPKEDAEKKIVGYQIAGSIQADDSKISTMKSYLGRFVLSTNVLDTRLMDDNELLRLYKGQSSVETGFSFIKNDTFEVDSVFLKKPKRIAALMAIMSLALLIYGACQLTIRSELAKHDHSVLNAAKKKTNKPTAKWIFRLFRMVHVVKINANDVLVEKVLGLNNDLIRIIGYFGWEAQKIYGLNH
jgi:transposase